MGFVFTGENDADIMHNSVTINLNVLEEQRKLNDHKGSKFTKIFYSGSSYIYPEHNQLDPDNPDCREESKISQQTQTQNTDGRNSSPSVCILLIITTHGIPVRVARYHNIFGPEGTWEGGREKAPA